MEKQEVLFLPSENNVFLIDWLTVVFFDASVPLIQALLGMDSPDIPWVTERAFRNGYPMRTYYKHISILWGADDEQYYTSDDKKSAADKVRYDMGICLDLSGQGCREFENFENNDWLKFLNEICSRCTKVNFTRIDLAYDDHIGTLDIHRIAQDVEDRRYTSPSRKSHIHWSDDQTEDIQGLTVEVGSKKSDVLIRIYDKAAERGFDHNRHWIRIELQLRNDRCIAAIAEIQKQQHVGRTAAGILRNYLMFRVPSGTDDNKSRWPVADYWDKVLLDMERIRIYISPGEPYNWSKTQLHMIKQYGQAILTFREMNGNLYDLEQACRYAYPVLNKKYQSAIDDFKRERAEAKAAEYRFGDFAIVPDTQLSYWEAERIFGGVDPADAPDPVPAPALDDKQLTALLAPEVKRSIRNHTCPRCGGSLTQKIGNKSLNWYCYTPTCGFYAVEDKNNGNIKAVRLE